MSDLGFTSSVIDDVDDFDTTTTTQVEADTPFENADLPADTPADNDDILGFGSPAEQESGGADPFFGGADLLGGSTPDATESKTDGDDLFGLGSAEPQPDAQQQSQLAAWRAEHVNAIQQKQDAERKEKARLAKEAQDDLAKFFSKREDQSTKNATRNRADEKQLKADLKNTMENGTDFEKVAKYCELRVKDEGKPPKNDRMRKLLIQLKNERPKA